MSPTIPSADPQARAAVAQRPDYWRFYWPLALTGLVSLLAQQLQNGALARYPDAARELAIFALAAGSFHLFDAALVFVPQMVNVLARSRAAARRVLAFTMVVCGVMTVPVILLSLGPVGGPILGALFHIKGDALADVLLYMAMLSPNVVMGGLRQYFTGQLVQVKRTGTVTILNVVYLVIVLVSLVVGFQAGWRAVITLAVSQLVAGTVQLALLWQASVRWVDLRDTAGDERVTYRDIFDFFWPVALTSVMFSLSRPILYSFLARLPNPEPAIAAMRVGFDFAMIFHNLLNQFRHLFVTFGADDLVGVRRFMTRVTAAVVGGMVLVVMTPLSVVLLEQVIGVRGDVLVMTRQVLMVMCLLPMVVTLRNYYHGLAMVKRRTGPMGAGAVMRNVATYLIAAALLGLGWLNHATGALILILGFLAETAVVVMGPGIMRGARAALAALPWPGGNEADES